MAGRAISRAKYEDEKERIASALQLPTERRDTPETYRPELVTELLALADCGLSQAEIAAHWCISEEELGEWMNGHSELKAAVGRARTRSKAWWERSAREAMATRDSRYPSGLFSHVMRARHPEEYGEKGVSITFNLVDKLVRMDLHHPELLGEQRLAGAKPLNEQASVGLDASPTASDDPANGPVIEGRARRVEPG